MHTHYKYTVWCVLTTVYNHVTTTTTKVIEHFVSLMSLCSLSPPVLPQVQTSINLFYFCLNRLVLLSLGFHVNVIIHVVWHLLLSIILRFIFVATCISRSCLLVAEWYIIIWYITVDLLIHDRHLSYFQFGDFMNKAIMNIHL